jgi:hypothetical protein
MVRLGISDADRWEAPIAAGLLCLIGCVAAVVTVMLREAHPQASLPLDSPVQGHAP